ncbi:hypothetical protein BMS3Bbin03_00911 [bacterium BMS3Bbin03]|nr:hypothetical protein BMS3Bbin03_00911 [bacterium BMS3Bbin03]HDL78781.1 hypothetical protein [Bacteroidota bacterium]
MEEQDLAQIKEYQKKKTRIGRRSGVCPVRVFGFVFYGGKMKRSKLMILIFFLAMIFSCQREKNPITPPVGGHIHPQVAIPWPSLAKSPWPMFHHDPQSTGRSPYRGPRKGRIKWSFKPDGWIHESIAIGPDSTIYFVSLWEQKSAKSSLYAIKPDGQLKWRYKFDQSVMDPDPLVAAGGTVYLPVPEGVWPDWAIYAISPDGTLKKKINPTDVEQIAAITMGRDGMLYFTSNDGCFYAMAQDGTVLWKLTTQGGLWSKIPVFSPDGNTVYLYGGRSTPGLYAINIQNHTIKWHLTFKDSLYYYSDIPMVDNEGNIYLGIDCIRSAENGNGFYSISPQGEINWHYKVLASSSEEGTIDPEGNIYFQAGTVENRLLAVNYDGNLRCQKNLNDRWTSLLSDKDGVIYVFQPDLSAYTQDGNILWNVHFEEQFTRITSAAIGYNGILYVGTFGPNSKLYAIE